MKRMQSGFTLIELVVVIVILGILAVTAVPRFINLSAEAEAAALQGVLGAVDSAAAINYAAYVGSNGAKGTSITAGADCATVIPAILQSGSPAGYTITGTVAAALTAGDTDTTCVITQVSSTNTVNPTLIITN